MIWTLNDEIRVRIVPLNFILERLVKGENPKTKEPTETWRVCGYYSSLESAIRALPSELAQCPDVETFEGLCSRLDKLAGQLSRRVGHG